jgi:hypothetical protein
MAQSLRMQLFHQRPLVQQPIQAAGGAPSSEFLHFADGRQCFLTLVGWLQPCHFRDL